MPKSPKRFTPGQQLYRVQSLSAVHDREASAARIPAGATRSNPTRSMQKWHQGMSRFHRERFASGVRDLRERYSLTRAELAKRAGVEEAVVDEAEQGERLPDEDTTVRVCWALDVAGGVTRDQL